MEQDEFGTFLRQLENAMMAIEGWAYLAMLGMSHDATQRAPLEQVKHTVMLLAQRIQVLQHHIQADWDGDIAGLDAFEIGDDERARQGVGCHPGKSAPYHSRMAGMTSLPNNSIDRIVASCDMRDS